MKRSIVLEIICFLLIALMLYAAVSRWLDFHNFIDEINNQPLPNSITPLIVYGIPALQVITAAALAFEKTRMTGLWISLSIMLLYVVYNTLILINFYGRTPCTCGGIIKHLTWGQHLIFSLFFAGVSLIGILLKRAPLTKGHGYVPADQLKNYKQ